ncbi:MAG: replication factor C large subunit, partial [Haloplanus sp.]
AMAAYYDLDEAGVAAVTGSGETTNKVESIVADAREIRESEMESHSGAFGGDLASVDVDDDADEADAAGAVAADAAGTDADADDNDDNDGQSGLSDFT